MNSWKRHLCHGAILCGALLVSLGCETTRRTTRDEGLSSAITDFKTGRYRQAFAAAKRSAHGRADSQARFVAGLAATQLGREQQALRFLRPLTHHRDSAIAGHASATLGLVYKDLGQFETARRHLQRAVTKLDGEDQAQAYFHLGVIEQRLGQWDLARFHLKLAAKTSHDPGFRRAARERRKQNAFTVQLGAFRKRSNARERAAMVRRLARRAHLGPPRIVRSRTAPTPVYRVLAGEFETYQGAVSARQRLGRPQSIVVATAR